MRGLLRLAVRVCTLKVVYKTPLANSGDGDTKRAYGTARESQALSDSVRRISARVSVGSREIRSETQPSNISL